MFYIWYSYLFALLSSASQWQVRTCPPLHLSRCRTKWGLTDLGLTSCSLANNLWCLFMIVPLLAVSSHLHCYIPHGHGLISNQSVWSILLLIHHIINPCFAPVDNDPFRGFWAAACGWCGSSIALILWFDFNSGVFGTVAIVFAPLLGYIWGVRTWFRQLLTNLLLQSRLWHRFLLHYAG